MYEKGGDSVLFLKNQPENLHADAHTHIQKKKKEIKVQVKNLSKFFLL